MNQIDNTSTTQSRSFATPKATPHSLSIAPAETNVKNHGRRSRLDSEVCRTEWARIIIAADNN